MEHKPSYTLRMYPISKSKINTFSELYSTKLESIIRIKFVAEVLQGIELHAGWCVLIVQP